MGATYDTLVERFQGNGLTVGNMVDAFLYPTGAGANARPTWQLGQTQFQTVADSLGFKGAYPWYDGYGASAPDGYVTPDNLVAVSRAFADPRGMISHDNYHRIAQVNTPVATPHMPSTPTTGGHGHGPATAGHDDAPMTDGHTHFTPFSTSNYTPYGYSAYPNSMPRQAGAGMNNGYAGNQASGFAPYGMANNQAYGFAPYGNYAPAATDYGMTSNYPTTSGYAGHRTNPDLDNNNGDCATPGVPTGGQSEPWGLLFVGWGVMPANGGNETPPMHGGMDMPMHGNGNPRATSNTNAALTRLAGSDHQISAGDVIDFVLPFDVGGGSTGRYDNNLSGREFGQAASTLGLSPWDFGALDGAAGRGRDGRVDFDDLIASVFTADRNGDGLLNAQEARGWASSIRAGGMGERAGDTWNGMGGAPIMPTPFPGMGWGWDNTGWGPSGGMPNGGGMPTGEINDGHGHSHGTTAGYMAPGNNPAGGYAMGNGGMYTGFGYARPSMYGPSNVTYN
jgi:hypothetical protein